MTPQEAVQSAVPMVALSKSYPVSPIPCSTPVTILIFLLNGLSIFILNVIITFASTFLSGNAFQITYYA